jgi:hypothetical protein
MNVATIMTGGPYKLISLGNGLAYALENHCFDSVDSEPLSVFVQGDDADTMRRCIEQQERAFPNKPTRDILGDVWCEYYQGSMCHA